MDSMLIAVQSPCRVNFSDALSNSGSRLSNNACVSLPSKIKNKNDLTRRSCKAEASYDPLRMSIPSAAASASPVLASAPPSAGQRAAEADVMGLLLRQRIVFLGNEMNDYVADAIVSQLLLLDAQDSTRDIRLFINCPGGSIRCAN